MLFQDPLHISQAQQAALEAGLDPEVVDRVLNFAAQFYHERFLKEHKPMTLEGLIELGTLYKYRDADDDRHWQILENQQLWFPLPNTFNDPFDANLGMRFDLLSDERLRTIAEAKIRAEQPGAGHFLLQSEVDKFLKWVHDPATHDAAMQQWIQRLTSKMRVFCICPDRGNILLWSHYAKNHTGFAIGFNSTKLHELWKASQGFQMGHVAYRETYPVMIPPTEEDKVTKADIITTIMNVKSDIWAYEKEVRMIMFDGPTHADFDPALISEVTIGCKMTAPHVERMLQLMDERYPHAAVYKAKLNREAFSLDFDKLRG